MGYSIAISVTLVVVVVRRKFYSGDQFISNYRLYTLNYNEVSKTEGGESRNKVECVQVFI